MADQVGERATLLLEGRTLDRGAPASEPVAPCRTFEQLVTEHHARIARLVQRLLGWSSDADDVVQEVFLAALDAWPKFRGASQASTWLVQIALNKCRTHRRRSGLIRRVITSLRERARERHAPPASAATLEQERNEQVRRALQGLPPRDREVLVLHYLEELPVAEIATLLNLNRGTVEVRLSRARKRLEPLLTRDC